MIDYKVFDVLSIIEQMIGKDSMYLTDAAKSGNLQDITLSFETEKDGKGVAIKVQHGVSLTWKGQ